MLCLDRAVLGRMNCPPSCTINPTSPVEHLQLVCSENALSAPSQVAPWFCAAQLAFSALWEGREQPGRCHVPAGSEQSVWFCSTRPVLFPAPLPGLQGTFGSSKSRAGEDGSSQPDSIYTPQIKITLSKHENTSIISFLILAVSLEMPLCSRAALHNLCQLPSAHGKVERNKFPGSLCKAV